MSLAYSGVGYRRPTSNAERFPPGYPVRKSIQQDAKGTRFPQLSRGDPEEPEGNSPLGWQRPCKKVLPDRSRAARDRANQKLVEYIVKTRGAESHLHAILKNGKPSRWLKMFLSSGQYVTCMETYLEDEEQLERVVKYLQGVYQDMDGDKLARARGDRIRFILDVLLPEVSGGVGGDARPTALWRSRACLPFGRSAALRVRGQGSWVSASPLTLRASVWQVPCSG